MQNEEIFCDVLNSIQFLNMTKLYEHHTPHHFPDSGFNSGAEINADNIFFYEDNNFPHNAAPSAVHVKSEREEVEEMPPDYSHSTSYFSASGSAPKSRRVKSAPETEVTQIQVNVGIDEDLKMILEMDPSLMDEAGIEKAVEPMAHVVDVPSRILGLPPKM